MNEDFTELESLILAERKLYWFFIGLAVGVFVPLVWIWVSGAL